MKTLFKNKTELFAIMMLIVLSIGSIPNFFSTSNHWQAYALTSQVITTTTAQTQDVCYTIMESAHTVDPTTEGLVWYICGNLTGSVIQTLHISNSAGVEQANLALGTFSGAGAQLMPVFNQPNQIILKRPDTDSFYKFRYTEGASPEIAQVGIYTPSVCSISSSEVATYDSNGYIWFSCTTEDQIVVFNPTTMTEENRSADLTSGAGIECDEPNDVMFNYNVGTTGWAFATCDTNNVLVSILVTVDDGNPANGSPDFVFTAEPTDDIAITFASASNSQFDTFSDRIMISQEATGISTYSFSTSTGILTSVLTAQGNAVAQSCYTDASYRNANNRVLVCGGTDIVQMFVTNSTGFFHVLTDSQLDSVLQPPMVGSYRGFEYYVMQGTVNSGVNKFLKLDDVETFSGGVEQPPSGEDEEGETNQINGVCGNTDVNGDGRVNVIDCTGGASAWSGFTSSIPAVQVVASITDGLGFTECAEDGSDQETCGSGLFTFLIILLIVEFGVLAGYLGLTSKLNADKQVVDVALIMLIAGFSVVALGFYLNWIPDIVFYSIIVIIAGFLVFGLIQRIKGG